MAFRIVLDLFFRLLKYHAGTAQLIDLRYHVPPCRKQQSIGRIGQ